MSECRTEYERPGGRQRGDRIVRCHLPAGHDGPHEEDETGVTWTRPEVLDPALLPDKALPVRDSSPPSPAQRPTGQTINGERLKLWVADYDHAAAAERNSWPVGARVQFDRFGQALADLDAAREELRRADEVLTITRAELSMTEAERLNYREEIERQRDALRRAGEVIEKARAEAAIQRVRELAEQYAANRQRGGFGQIPVAQLLAALDSTDPVEAAPEKRTCPDAMATPDGCPTEWRYSEGGVWHHCTDVRSYHHDSHVCRCGSSVAPPLTIGEDAQPCRYCPRCDYWKCPSDGTHPDVPAPGRSGEEKFVECQLPVGWEWCALRIGHAGQCDPRPSVKEGRAANAPTRPRWDAGLPVDGEEQK